MSKRDDEALRATIAVSVASSSLLRRIPAVSRETARCEALAIAMGVLHGCCGPNGDFSSEPHHATRGDAMSQTIRVARGCSIIDLEIVAKGTQGAVLRIGGRLLSLFDLFGSGWIVVGAGQFNRRPTRQSALCQDRP